MSDELDHKRMIRDLLAHNQWRQIDLSNALPSKPGQAQISKWLGNQRPQGHFWLELRQMHRATFDQEDLAIDRSIVTIRGLIGAGAEIMPELEQVPEDGLYRVKLALPVPAGAVAFEVRGKSMMPRFSEGDVVVCWTRATNPEQAIGWEAAVQTVDGRRFVKTIAAGTKAKRFHLLSFNDVPMLDQALEWIAKVDLIVPNANWSRIE